jgi:hypothetical protein
MEEKQVKKKRKLLRALRICARISSVLVALFILVNSVIQAAQFGKGQINSLFLALYFLCRPDQLLLDNPDRRRVPGLPGAARVRPAQLRSGQVHFLLLHWRAHPGGRLEPDHLRGLPHCGRYPLHGAPLPREEARPARGGPGPC